MPWGKLKTDLHDHPKTRRARKGGDRPRDASAIGLWTLALSWCLDNYETNGWVPADELDRWDTDCDVLAQRLHAAGLWEPAQRDGEDGWQFRNYTEHQTDADTIEADKAAARERMRGVRANGKRTKGARAPKVHDSDTDVDVDKNTTASAAADGAFDTFWSLYPRKIAKGAARKAYTKALRTTDAATIAAGLGRAVAGWKAAGTESTFIPHASTWLNAERWTDDVQVPGQTTVDDQLAEVMADDPEPHPARDPEAHLAWRKRRAAQRRQLQGANA